MFIVHQITLLWFFLMHNFSIKEILYENENRTSLVDFLFISNTKSFQHSQIKPFIFSGKHFYSIPSITTTQNNSCKSSCTCPWQSPYTSHLYKTLSFPIFHTWHLSLGRQGLGEGSTGNRTEKRKYNINCLIKPHN